MTQAAPISRDQLEQLLRFYAESGLDVALETEPQDRFAQSKTPPASPKHPPAQATPPVAPATPAAVVPDAQAIALAETIAAEAPDLEALKTAVEAFEACNLKRSARHTLLEGGRRGAKVMLIGAAPSRDDDKNGAALSGLDGLLLEKMLAAIGLDRNSDIYCGFCVPWAVPGGERPTPLHLKICAPFLRRQIALAEPRMLVCLGNAAAQHVFDTRDTIMRLRGTWRDMPSEGRNVAATALFEPAFLREQPRLKRLAWLDLLAIKQKLATEA